MRPVSEIAKRYRAARSYAGLRQEDLAEALGVDTQTIKRREAGNHGAKRSELVLVASTCGLPFEWFTADLGRLPEIAVTRPAGAGAPPPPGVTGRRLGADEPSAPGQSQPESTPGEDSPTGTDE